MSGGPWGVTPNGFAMKRLSDITTELETGWQALLGAGINLAAGSKIAQIIGYQASREADIWQLAADVYNAFYPNSSDGANLDNVLSMIAVSRLGALNSLQQNLCLFGTVGDTIPAGTQVFPVGNPTAIFVTANNVTLIAGTNCVQTVSFSNTATGGTWTIADGTGAFISSPLAYNITAAALQAILNAFTPWAGVTVTGSMSAGFTLTFAGASGSIPWVVVTTVSSLTYASGNVTITPAITTAGVAQGQVNATCTLSGAIGVAAYALTGITTPVTGLSSILNLTAAVTGRAVETDPAFRARAASAQATSGLGTVPAIQAALLATLGVTAAVVYENTGDTTDGNGNPPHSFQSYVQGGADQDVANTIWNSKPAGIATNGGTTVTVTDTQGVTHSIKFSRPVVVDIYVKLTVVRNVSAFPSNGAAQVVTAIQNYIDGLTIGQPVISFPALIASLNNIAGILNITSFLTDTFSDFRSNSNANISIAANSVARVNNPSTDITVTLA